MSTILKSLRKLEEEKKAVDKKLNLKEMMIREDKRPPMREEVMGKPGHWWAGLGLLVGGLVVAGFMAILLWPKSEKAINKTPNNQISPTQESTSRTKITETSKSLGGVPLSSIPDFNQTPIREEEEIVEEFFIQEEPSLPLETEIPPEPVQPVASVPSQPEQAPEVEPEANDQIVSALGRVPAQTRTTLEPTPHIPTIIPADSGGESIEGLELKGIIFYGEGSPENYLLFSYPGMSIHRLKVGESIADAKLLEIHPGLAVFQYGARQIRMKVGS